MKKTRWLLLFSLLFISLLAACSNDKDKNKDIKVDNPTVKQKIKTGKSLTVVAKEATHVIDGHKIDVLTFDGSIPGTEIHVKQGEKVKITLKNELKEDSITMHFHGYPVPNAMDGVPGVTQNAVKPGQTFTYEFTATVPGTYWYHSHQHGVYQLEKGLYGTFIVDEAKKSDYDIDKTLVLDEWTTKKITSTTKHSHGSGSMDDMYQLYTINGETGDDIEKLSVKKGDKVRLRLINAGFTPKYFVLEGHKFKVIALDGNKVEKPSKLQNKVIKIGAAERYDIEFTANNPGDWKIKFISKSKKTQAKLDKMTMNIVYDKESMKHAKRQDRPVTDIQNTFDYTQYGIGRSKWFSLNDKFDVEYTMELNTTMSHHTFYTINNAIYPLTEDIKVKSGDLVKVTLKNYSPYDDHPMHLHGHTFQILSRNNEPVKGSPVYKDTVNLSPGEVIVLAFRANNKGIWMFHCHDLHHASGGMVTHLIYTDFTQDPSINKDEHNMPE
ncbi:copper oxidase [Priestia megaterium]|nr:copper oxidase [Priestia megaterium]